jgi:hypothetical protein
MDFREIGREGVGWMYLAQDRDQWQALNEHGNEPSASIKGREFLDLLSDSQEGLCSMELVVCMMCLKV